MKHVMDVKDMIVDTLCDIMELKNSTNPKDKLKVCKLIARLEALYEVIKEDIDKKDLRDCIESLIANQVM